MTKLHEMSAPKLAELHQLLMQNKKNNERMESLIAGESVEAKPGSRKAQKEKEVDLFVKSKIGKIRANAKHNTENRI